MIDKEICADGTVRVRFTVPAAFKAVAVVGDFNHWNPQRTRFRREGDRSVASVILDAGRRYSFQYLTAGGAQCNDEAADDYEVDDLGAFHGVLDLAPGYAVLADPAWRRQAQRAG